MNNLKVLEFDQVIFILYNTILSVVDDDGLCVMLKDLFSENWAFWIRSNSFSFNLGNDPVVNPSHDRLFWKF